MILALAVFLAALLLTALYLRLGRRWGAVDTPGERSAHRRPTLSSGGVPLMLVLLPALAAAPVPGGVALAPRETLALLPAALLCVAGALDDLRPLPVVPRLLLFLACAAGTVILYLPPGTLSSWLLLPVLVLAVAWVINLYNFMDGIDGLAALQCVLVAGGIAFLAALDDAGADYVAAGAATAAAYAAFLCFNRPPARLFMGDAGSLAAGYLLAWLGLWGWVDGALPPALWLLLMSPFLIDTGFTLVARWLRGAPVTQAHSEHLYQHLARRWMSHRRVDLLLLLLQLLWLQPLAALAALEMLPALPALALGLAPQLLAVPFCVACDRSLQ